MHYLELKVGKISEQGISAHPSRSFIVNSPIFKVSVYNDGQ